MLWLCTGACSCLASCFILASTLKRFYYRSVMCLDRLNLHQEVHPRRNTHDVPKQIVYLHNPAWWLFLSLSRCPAGRRNTQMLLLLHCLPDIRRRCGHVDSVLDACSQAVSVCENIAAACSVGNKYQHHKGVQSDLPSKLLF